MRNLNKREKRLLQIFTAFVAVLIVYFLIVIPLIGFKGSIEKESESNISKLNKLDQIYEQYRDIQFNSREIQRKLKNQQGTTTLIEENAKSLNMLRNKVYTRDRPSNIQGKYKKISTDVKFEGVDIVSILNFLYKMENSGKLIKVSYIRINQALKGRNTYDVTMKFDTLTTQ